MTTEAELIVDRFIASWRRGDVEDMLECCADDVRYQNMPMEPGVGTAALREVQEERIGYFSIGGSAITLPVCGVFEIESGRIAAWREYFDMATGTPA